MQFRVFKIGKLSVIPEDLPGNDLRVTINLNLKKMNSAVSPSRSMNSQFFILIMITISHPLPIGSRAVIDWPLVAGDLTAIDVDDHRQVRSASSIQRSMTKAMSSNEAEESREPWQINKNICPPPLSHLCNIQLQTRNGETQSSFVTPFFEGDIVLDWDQRRQLGLSSMSQRSSRSRSRRAIIEGRDRRWPDAIIPYTIDSDFNHETVRLIKSALRHWQQNTCIRFVQKEPFHHDYLRFAYFPGCWSFIGRQGGEQLISMGPGCKVFSTIVHELGHAIGYWHEQSRQDRDQYIQIVQRNIAQGTEENFNKIDIDNVTSLGYPYDFASVMHYSANAFSANGKPTIRMKKRYRELLPDVRASMNRPSNGLSELDIAQTRGLYECNVRAARRQKKEPCFNSESGDGRDYRGNVDFTESGITCQKWTSKYPHEHDYMSEDDTINESLGVGHHNFCRNPGGQERPWCFTTLKNTVWEYCDVKLCPSS
ncbi:zinc metalloproteinase nas-37-like [Lytechinus variegatus]|uniref:zinc metalloproteinase nas-37-like n=1 Tax=Lytechinus variegatus TaxID=7654 RepID=UPI001BB198E7|nr:zinc metalloproteinase nas-37-like [Lytechinus variegatus]XP_041462960.1 zinc metalloproteinase nas-37-like [Lytechinus variegatus]XP_041462961.1 zinc metalloproteinase nas-37-like [Lytechinus variegatus]